MQVGGDDAHLRLQLADVPHVLAQHADRRRPVGPRQRPLLMRQQPQQHRLAGAIRPEDDRVLAVVNGQRHAVDYGPIAFDDGRGVELQEGREALA